MFILSNIADCQWPAIPGNVGAQALALQYQLEQSQWLCPDDIRSYQFKQLQHVLREVFSKIDYWRDTLSQVNFAPDRALSESQFIALPILGRMDVQRLGERLVNPSPPQSHGKTYKCSTSGSTGTPVVFYQTDITQHFWRGLTLREHLWQRRDFSGKLASIRSNVTARTGSNWGAATEKLVETGPVCTLNSRP
jgi:phenylacetate-CoA ligase